MRIKNCIIIILFLVLDIPLSIIGINAYSDRNIVLKAALSHGRVDYYILRSNRVLELYQGYTFNIYDINRHYFLDKTIKKASTVISEEDYNNLLEYANEVIHIPGFISAQGNWIATIYYRGYTYETPDFDLYGYVNQFLNKLTGISPIPFEYRDKYFGPEKESRVLIDSK